MNKPRTTLEYLLLSLVPYTRQNIHLATNPAKFYYELEKITNAKESVLRSTMSRAQKQGYVDRKKGKLTLTEKGMSKIRPYTTEKLPNNGVVMVMFDIPEEIRSVRQKFRNYLKYYDFELIQKSVWVSNTDYREELKTICSELNINQYVEIFQAARI